MSTMNPPFNTPLTAASAPEALAGSRVSAKGLLGDCDLRWLAVATLLCAIVLRFIALR